ncbi:TerC family protein [Endozoicomonas atrinae]|uniref:TerC family protein n=1 Tax=Endozoicomonas atrinae TaxID=1333660 RepID=UPI003B009244
MDLLFTPESLIALLTLTSLEIVLGIDNIIFLTILVDRLPSHQRAYARNIGLGLAMITRLGLLFSLSWIMSLTETLFFILDQAISGRDIILLTGGLFLIWKSTHEIHESIEGLSEGEPETSSGKQSTKYFFFILGQIAIIDVVFSLDSVITAVGLVNQLWVMVSAIVLAVIVMMFAARSIGEFVSDHPTLKVLALSFLILIGVSLVADGLDFHIPKGYIYFAMAFSLIVEMLNSRLRKRPIS